MSMSVNNKQQVQVSRVHLQTAFENSRQLRLLLAEKLSIYPNLIITHKREGAFTWKGDAVSCGKLMSKNSKKVLSENNIEVVSGFSGFYHKTIYMKDLPRELVELSIDEIKSELEKAFDFKLFKVTKTNIRGRPGLVVLCNSETEASLIQAKKSILVDGWNVNKTQMTVNNGPPIYQCKNYFKIGHRTNWCKNSRLCENCGQNYHGSECDKNKFCVLCNKECGHIALQFRCPTRKVHVKNKSLKLQGNSKAPPSQRQW